jgi:hypothetical protein
MLQATSKIQFPHFLQKAKPTKRIFKLSIFSVMTDNIKKELRALRTPQFSKTLKTTLRIFKGLGENRALSLEQSISTIAKKRKRVKSTIEGHLCELVQLGKIKSSVLVSVERIKQIESAIYKLDSIKATPVNAFLGELDAYFEIRCVVNAMAYEFKKKGYGELGASLPPESGGAIFGASDFFGRKKVAGTWGIICEDEVGHSYDTLFTYALNGAKHIHLQDPFLAAQRHQRRNLMEFCKAVSDTGVRKVKVVVRATEDNHTEMLSALETVRDEVINWKIDFEFAFDPVIHDRWIQADNGTLILLGRGLDIFKSFSNHLENGVMNPLLIDQSLRPCREFQVAVLKIKD